MSARPPPHRRFVRAALALLAALALAGAAPREAHADDEASACTTAHLASQKNRRDHRLAAAQRDLLVCAREACPALIRSDCADWLVRVRAEMPSIVLDVRAPDGTPLSSARTLVDGVVVAETLDGRAVEVDPGEHVVRVEAPGRPPTEKRTLVLEGGRAQRVVVTLGERPPASSSEAPVPSATLPLVVGAGGIVALGLFAGFGLAGLSTRNDLDDLGCAPRCDPETTDRMRRDFVIADVSLLIGVGALTVAGVLLVLRGGAAARAPAATSQGPPRIVW